MSGTASTGQTMTVSGSGFGTKASAAPYKFDDFQSGAVGQRISTGGVHPWELYASEPGVAELPQYQARTSNAQPRYPGDRSSWQEFGKRPDTGGYFVSNNSIILRGVGDRVYLSGWTWHDRSADTLANATRNFKVFQHTNDPYSTPVQSRWDTYPYDINGGFSGHLTSYSDGLGPLGGGYDINNWDATLIPKRVWQRVEIFHDRNVTTPGTEVFSVWVDGRVKASSTVPARSGLHADGIWITFYFADVSEGGVSGSAWMDWYWSELYIDNTQARIELGDSATWSTNTHREIQLPTYWSSNSINFTVKAGSFAAGQNVYLYVVDASGAVNANGYLVQLGGSTGGSDTIAPTEPQNLRPGAGTDSNLGNSPK